MYKALITRQNADGTFDEVGMSNRTVRKVRSYQKACEAAKAFAKGHGWRVECFPMDRFYGPPYKVFTWIAT